MSPANWSAKMSPHEGFDIEPAGTDQDPSTKQRSGIRPTHRPGFGDHGIEPTPHQTSSRGLSQRRSRRTGPREPGTEAPQRRPRGRRGRSGGVGRRTLRRRQPYSPYRTAQRARGHRPEPSHGAPHPDQGRHGQPAQSSLSAAPVPEAAHAPEGHAGTGRWQSPPLARRAGAEACVAAGGGRRHRCCGPGDLPHHGRHPRLHGAP